MAQPGFGFHSLPVGTEVSAKYRGAFCEAKVKTVVRLVKCKVVMKDGQSNIFVTDEEVKGCVKVGAVVEIKHPATGQPVEATINKLLDHSSYTVVFDDGDERTLRRTQLCLKGDKHFIESETLDNLPLSHPEHFGTPVLQYKKARRKNDDESDDGEEKLDEESPRRAMYRGRHQELVGKIMLIDLPNRKGSVIPALIVLPDASSQSEVKNRDQILVRSFKDSKFITVVRKNLKDFSRVVAVKNDDKTMRAAFEKALLYHDTKELPVGWDKNEMLGSDFDSGDVDDEYASEDEPFEEKDRFVAQLYKFMDERGTPINKGPCIGSKDLNLYRLYKIVKNLGGYNKVTKEMKWPIVYSKMGLTSVHLSPAHQIKTAYKKYLDAFETFYRKLGSTMGTMSRPGRARQSEGRSILSFRAREKTPKSPKPPEKVTQNKEVPESTKQKPQVSPEKSEDSQDAVSVPSTSEGDVVIRRTPRRDAGAQSLKEESRDKKEETEKAKKEESPKSKKEEKKDETPVPKPKKEESPVPKPKKDETPVPKPKKDETPVPKLKKEESPVPKSKKEETPVPKPKKEETTVLKPKKEETPVPKPKKEETPVPKPKKETPVPKPKKDVTPVTKFKKEEVNVGPKAKKDEVTKGKKEDDILLKDERKSSRKIKVEDDKVLKGAEKEKEDENKEEVKQETVVPVKEDSPKKRVTRRKITSLDVKKDPEVKEEIEEKKEPAKKLVSKEQKVVEKKEELPRTLERRDSQTSEKKESPLPVKVIDKKEKPVEKKAKPAEEKKPKKEKKGKEDEDEEDEEEASDDGKTSPVSAQSEEVGDVDLEIPEYPIGSRLRVKYGRGKNQKIYIAKVIEHGRDGVHRTYLVHYAGWNTRYDEWIRPDRVVSVLDRPEGESARTPPSRSPSMPGSSKDSLSPSSANMLRIPLDMSKPGQIFRRPRLIGARMRSTRSSSSELSFTRKRMTRRHSALTDSVGSRSPGSHISSGAEDASDSEQPGDDEDDDGDDDYDHHKDDNTRDDDLLDVDDYENADESLDEKTADVDTSMEEESDFKEEPKSEIVSEGVKEELEEVDSEKKIRNTNNKETNIFDQTIGKISVAIDVNIQSDEKKESKDSPKKDSLKEPVVKSTNEIASSSRFSGMKCERKSVCVAEVRESVYEIKSSVYYGDEDIKHEVEEDSHVKKAKVLPEVAADIEETEPPKLEMPAETYFDVKEEQCEKTDQVETLAEEVTPIVVPEQDSPQLKKVDSEREKKENQSEKAKTVRGGKKNITKDGKKSTRTSEVAIPEMPTIEAMILPPVLTPGKLEPSPYDFDAEVDTPWQPEITKKWEPSQKAVPVVKECKESVIVSEEIDEKDKKVKKKVKKKSAGVEFAENKLHFSADDTIAADTSDRVVTSPTSGDTSTEGKGSKKKGRKKKEMSSETKKEVSELYEITVNSVVEAVKHSLQETESDQEQRPAVKKRRMKRLSESDKKNSATRLTRVGRKVANRDSIDVLDSNLNVEDHSVDKEQASTCAGPSQNEPALSQPAQTDELSSASTSAVEPEVSMYSRDIRKEPSFCESQGFEPQLQNLDTSAHFDNTPPTTPEHEEEENKNAAMQHPENQCHISDFPSKSDLLKDSVIAQCASSSATSSLSLLANASSFVPSKPINELPSDNDVTSTASTENQDTALMAQQSEGSGTDQDVPFGKKRNVAEDTSSSVAEVKKRRVHGTRSRTAKKSPKYTGNSDSQGSASNTPNHYPESPPVKFADLSKSPRPSKYTFNADLGEYLEGEARCNFLINKMREIKSIYMTLKSEVASIDRRRKRAKRKERESSQISSNDKEVPT